MYRFGKSSGEDSIQLISKLDDDDTIPLNDKYTTIEIGFATSYERPRTHFIDPNTSKLYLMKILVVLPGKHVQIICVHGRSISYVLQLKVVIQII